MSIGLRWVRAIYLDSEVRADWEQYLANQRDDYAELLQSERDEITCRWLQGKLQAIEELDIFVARTMAEHKKAERGREPALSS